MSNTPTISVREWTDLVRRARLGKTTKYVALMLATYADFRDGCRIRPGLRRIAWEAEVDIKTARKAVGELVRVGLVEQVRAARGRGGATEYRLIIGPDLLEHVDVPSPARARVEIDALAERQRGEPNGCHPAAPKEPVDNPDWVPPGGTQNPPSDASIGYHPVPPNGAIGYHPVPLLGTTPSPPSPTDLSQDRSPNSGEDLRTAVTHTRATGPDQDPISPVCGNPKCVRGFVLSGDGQSIEHCPDDAHPPPANVIPLRPRTA